MPDDCQAKPALPAASEPRKLALVVPTLREAEALPSLLTRLRAALCPLPVAWEIIVVDDDSRDGTVELVSALAQQDARIRLIVREGERGLSGAILRGWQNTDADLLGVIDADLQHPPELLPTLLASMRAGHDVAIASRYAKGGALGGWNPMRRLISAAAVWATIPLQRRVIRAHDPMSGFFLVRRRSVQNLVFQPAGFKLLLEILVRGSVGSLAEVPFAFGHRAAGASKANLKTAWEYLLLLCRLYHLRRSEPRIVPSAMEA